MPSPESSRRNLEHARRIGRVKFWRRRPESQRVKAEILQAYFAVPRPSQRAIAQRLRVSQPYVAKLSRKIRREGPEKAVGPEAYEQYRALRDAELTKRHEGLVAHWQRSQGQTTPPSGSSADTSAKPAQQEGPTQYVELARTTSGDLFELHGSAPPSARPCDAPSPQRGGIPIRRIWEPSREQMDKLLREWAGITRTNRGNSWF